MKSSLYTHAFAIHPELRNYTKCESRYFIVRFEILTEVATEGYTFWDITVLPSCYLLHADFLLSLSFDPENGGDVFI
jgi:hypothetical protein